MKTLLITILLGALLAGCAPAAGAGSMSPANAPAGPGIPAGATDTPATGSGSSQSAPPVNRPLVITVRPPMLPVAPVQGAPASGWRTFTSAGLQVALDYPADWSVTEQAGGAVFTSPQGLKILLQADQSTASSPPAGQSCSTLINSHGQTGQICLEAAASRYSATFEISGTEKLTLSVVSHDKPGVFFQMFDTLRPAN